MAKVSDAPAGSVIEETKRTRIVPPTEKQELSTQGKDFWTYQSQIPPGEWKNYILYVYRGTTMKNNRYVAKYMHSITPDFIVEKHGGGEFLLVLNRGPEMLFRESFEAEGAPIVSTVPPVASAPAGEGREPSDLALVLNRLVDLIERRDNPAGSTLVLEAARNGMTIQADGLRAASQAIASVQPAAPAASRSEALMDRFMEAMIAKMINPPSPTDPIETFAKMMAAMKGLGFPGGGGGGNNWGMELVRNLPTMLGEVGRGLENYKAVAEANARVAEINAGRAPTPPQQPLNVGARAIAAPQPNPAPVPVGTAAPMQVSPVTDAGPVRQPWQDMIETQIGNVISRANTVDDAADEAMTVVVNFDANLQLLQFLVQLGEEGLLAVFQQSPILKTIPVSPQLKQFIKKFIELGTIELQPPAPDNSAPQPGAPGDGLIYTPEKPAATPA